MAIKNIFKKKISLGSGLLLAVFGAACMFGINYALQKNADDSESSETKLSLTRNGHYQLTKPIIAFDLPKESKDLMKIKHNIEKEFEASQSSGELLDASMYLRNLETGEWTTVNDAFRYHPGSLMKVPLLMYYLKQAETDASLLNKTYVYTPANYKAAPTVTDQTIKVGVPYTIRELLASMITYSDNDATILLFNNANLEKLQDVFVELGLAKPNLKDINYTINVKEYSLFMRALYNATYLSPQQSDTALALLSKTTFNKGLKGSLPQDITVAHKFGETNAGASEKEFHESGIIYCNNKPYMLTIMTRGRSTNAQAKIIDNISLSIFKAFCN